VDWRSLARARGLVVNERVRRRSSFSTNALADGLVVHAGHLRGDVGYGNRTAAGSEPVGEIPSDIRCVSSPRAHLPGDVADDVGRVSRET
jgi:hypothetical protein